MVDQVVGSQPENAKTNSNGLLQSAQVGGSLRSDHFPDEPIDCVTLRRNTSCMLSINAIDVPELVFRLEGEKIVAVSQGRTTPLKMPNLEVEQDVLRMLRSDPKSVYLVEIDPCGDVVLTHDIGVAS